MKQQFMGSDKEEPPPERQEMDQGFHDVLGCSRGVNCGDLRVADLSHLCKPLGQKHSASQKRAVESSAVCLPLPTAADGEHRVGALECWSRGQPAGAAADGCPGASASRWCPVCLSQMLSTKDSAGFPELELLGWGQSC